MTLSELFPQNSPLHGLEASLFRHLCSVVRTSCVWDQRLSRRVVAHWAG